MLNYVLYFITYRLEMSSGNDAEFPKKGQRSVFLQVIYTLASSIVH